ncbi:hypothetical protein, partial [Ensifer sp. Root142]|uniref:hypothetical protein n=1 Tax=Ensifer sp. Root142 TaxID=1736461 RepID=UPI001FCDB3B6
KVDIPIYDQDGLAVASREDRAAALAEWGAEFREAYAVNALATFSFTVADTVDDTAFHDALNAAFGSKPFLYSRHSDGKVSVYAVTDLPAKKIAGALKTREKGEGPARGLRGNGPAGQEDRRSAEDPRERRGAGARCRKCGSQFCTPIGRRWSDGRGAYSRRRRLRKVRPLLPRKIPSQRESRKHQRRRSDRARFERQGKGG